MSKIFAQLIDAVKRGEVRISEHGYDELSQDDLSARVVLDGIDRALVLEDYPDFPKGACVLVLQTDQDGEPVHVVWGIPKGRTSPAVLVTAYRPDPERWEANFTRRRQ